MALTGGTWVPAPEATDGDSSLVVWLLACMTPVAGREIDLESAFTGLLLLYKGAAVDMLYAGSLVT